MIQVRSAFHYIWGFWDDLRSRLSAQADDRLDIKAVLMKYKKFLEIFPTNAEIRQDFEMLELFLEDYSMSSSNNLKSSNSHSLPMLRLICQDDGLPITVIQIIQNLLNYRSIRKKKAVFNIIYNSIDVIMKFSEFLKDFIAKDLPEIEILIDDVEPLIQEAEILLCELCKSSTFAFRKLFSTLAIIEKEFPVTEEYESRLLLLPSMSTCNTEENNCSIDVLSEQTIICGLRCSFSLITSLIAVKFDKTLNHKIPLLELQGEDLINTLNSLLLQSHNSSAVFKQRVEDILNIQIQKKTMTVKGLSIPREIRFTTEVNLYENTADMLNKGSEIIHLLENIRVCSVNIIKNKSDKILVPYKDIKNDDDDTNSRTSSENYKIKKEKQPCDNNSTLQNLQIELERQLKSLVTLMKLENQIINKVTRKSNKTQNISLLKSTQDDKINNEEQNLNESMDNVNHSQNEPCPTSYENSTKEGEHQPPHHHDYILNNQVLDELFELVPRLEGPNDEHDEEISFDDRSNDGVQEARQVVLEQLKSVLKPRHDMMKSREEEAYKRAYGDRQVPLDDDIEIEENILEKKRKARQALLDELRLAHDEDGEHSRSDGDMCEIDYGDDDNDDNSIDNNKFNNENDSLFSSSDFKSRLDKILKSGAGSSYS